MSLGFAASVGTGVLGLAIWMNGKFAANDLNQAMMRAEMVRMAEEITRLRDQLKDDSKRHITVGDMQGWVNEFRASNAPQLKVPAFDPPR